MSSAPRVSVVVIYRDAESFLDEAIASVFAQTFADWELLLIDDGSVDGGPFLAANWASQHPQRVHCLAHPGRVNRGMSASRNLGVRHARGEYVALLDADDVWCPTTLADQVAVLDVWPQAAFVYGPLQWWYAWSGKAHDKDRDFIERLGIPHDTLVRPPTLVPLFVRDKAAVPSGLLIRRAVLHHVGGFEDAFRGEYEDQVLCAKICLKWPVFASGRCWYRYRQHEDSCVSVGQLTGQSTSTRLVFLRWLAGYLLAQRVWRP